jgi:L-ascorbate metabolism protein UlaG (beta-lactamase superfamily)
MEITWYGHSCFLIKDSSGRKLLTDPFKDSIGYKKPNEAVDIITISHHHFDHDCTDNLPGVPNTIDTPGLFNVCDIPIQGITSYHDKVRGAKRGDNIIYTFEMDGFRLCHLGDLGHPLEEQVINTLGRIDVLFIPVGGNYTIDGKEAAAIAKRINSHIVLPMHYKTPDLFFPLEGVENFLINMKNGEKVGGNTLYLEKTLELHNSVKLLEYVV